MSASKDGPLRQQSYRLFFAELDTLLEIASDAQRWQVFTNPEAFFETLCSEYRPQYEKKDGGVGIYTMTEYLTDVKGWVGTNSAQPPQSRAPYAKTFKGFGRVLYDGSKGVQKSAFNSLLKANLPPRREIDWTSWDANGSDDQSDQPESGSSSPTPMPESAAHVAHQYSTAQETAAASELAAHPNRSTTPAGLASSTAHSTLASSKPDEQPEPAARVTNQTPTLSTPGLTTAGVVAQTPAQSTSGDAHGTHQPEDFEANLSDPSRKRKRDDVDQETIERRTSRTPQEVEGGRARKIPRTSLDFRVFDAQSAYDPSVWDDLTGEIIREYMGNIATSVLNTAISYFDFTKSPNTIIPMHASDLQDPTPEAMMMFIAVQGLKSDRQDNRQQLAEEASDPRDYSKLENGELASFEVMISVLGMIINYIIFQGIDDVRKWGVCSKSVPEHKADIKQKILDGISNAMPGHDQLHNRMAIKWGGLIDDLTAFGGASTLSSLQGRYPEKSQAAIVRDVTNQVMELLEPFTPLLYVDTRRKWGYTRSRFTSRPYFQFRTKLEELIEEALDFSNALYRSPRRYMLRWFHRGEKYDRDSMELYENGHYPDLADGEEYDVLTTMMPGLIDWDSDGSKFFFIIKAKVRLVMTNGEEVAIRKETNH